MEFRILGSLTVLDDGAVLPVSGAKQRRLLALLLISANQVVSVDQLIEHLWDGQPPGNAPGTLWSYVSNLRRLVGDRLVTQRPGYLLKVGTDDLDATRFEAMAAEARRLLREGDAERAWVLLGQALDLWQGRALAEYADAPFAMTAAARLTELRAVALEDQMDAGLLLGRHAELVAQLEALVTEFPLRERLWGQLMVALYRSGRQAEALRAFQALRRDLVDELGIEPSADLARLEDEILAQRASLTWPPDRVPVRAPQAGAAPPAAGTLPTASAPTTPAAPAAPSAATTPAAPLAPAAAAGGATASTRLPAGTVTFLLTDIEGSAALWEARVAAMGTALARHEAIIAGTVAGHAGHLIKARGEGDSTLSVFARASDAVAAGLELQQQIADEPWPEGLAMPTRVAIHTGEAELRDEDYFGPTVNRAARIRGLARGGQVLLSQSTADLVAERLPAETSLASLGRHALKGLSQPEHLFGLVHHDVTTDFSSVVARSRAGIEALVSRDAQAGQGGFVGRAAELAKLRDHWNHVLAGERRFVLLSGEPGIGKTRLAAEFASTVAGEGAMVLFGRSDEDLLVPYQPFVEVVRTYAASCAPRELAEQLGPYAGELAKVVPEVAERLPVIPSATPAEPETERYRLFEAVSSLVTEASRTAPVVLLLDDLHWADRPTMLLLRHIVRHPDPAAVLIIGTHRQSETGRGQPLTEVLATLWRDRAIDRIPLGGLDESQVSTLMDSVAGGSLGPDDGGLAARIQQETAGNPFFVGEIVRHLAETGGAKEASSGAPLGIPEGVREVIGSRLSRLSEQAYQLLEIAAVIGTDFGFDVLAAASGMDETAALAAVDEAIVAYLVVELADSFHRYSFSHALVRDAVYQGLSINRRLPLHRQIGEALERLHGSSPTSLDLFLAELAHHFAEAGPSADPAKAIDYARRTGDRDFAQLAYESAAGHYQRAAAGLEAAASPDGPARAHLLLAAGESWNRAGDVEVAKPAFLRAADLARSLDRPDLLTKAALGYGGPVPVAADVDDPQVLTLLDEAVGALGGVESADRALALGRLAQWLYRRGSHARRAELCGQAVAIARKNGDPATLAAVLKDRYWALYGPDDIDGRLAAADEIARIAERLGDKEGVLSGITCRLHVLLELGDIEEAEALAARRDRLAEELREPQHYWAVVAHRAMKECLTGQFDTAERSIEEAFEIRTRTDRLPAQAVYGSQLFMLRWLQGRLPELGRTYARLVERHPERLAWRAVYACVLASGGENEEASAQFDELAAEKFTDIPRTIDWYVSMASLSETANRLGDGERAQMIYEQLLPFEHRNCTAGQSSFYGAVAHHLGVAAGTVGMLDEAVRCLSAGLERHRTMAPAFVPMSQAALAGAR